MNMAAKMNKAERQARLKQTPSAPDKQPTREDLYQEAKALGITGASSWTKPQLTEAIAAWTAKPEPTTPEGKHELGEQRISEASAHYAETKADPDAPKASERPAERSNLAKQEVIALKAWQLGGSKGERPLTPNYDYIAALYTGVARESGRKARTGGGTRRSKSGGPRRVEADAAKEACGGKRGTGVRISDDDLRAYIATAHAEHPDSSRGDEREYAYWVERLSLNGRWGRFWREVVSDVDQPALPDEEQAEPEGDDPDAIAAALAEVEQAGKSIRAATSSTRTIAVTPIPKKAPAKRRKASTK